MGGAQSPRQTQRARPPAKHPQQSVPRRAPPGRAPAAEHPSVECPQQSDTRLRAAQAGQAWPELGVGGRGEPRGGRRSPPGVGGGPPGVEEGLVLPLRPPMLEFLLRTVVKLLVFTQTFILRKLQSHIGQKLFRDPTFPPPQSSGSQPGLPLGHDSAHPPGPPSPRPPVTPPPSAREGGPAALPAPGGSQHNPSPPCGAL